MPYLCGMNTSDNCSCSAHTRTAVSHDGCECGHTHNHHVHTHTHGGHDHHHHHAHGAAAFLPPAISFAMLVAGLLMSHFHVALFEESLTVEYVWYLVAFLPVGLPVVKDAAAGIVHGDIFNEFTLMVIACVGAFCIRELPEAVGVMLFYSIGESLQHGAVDRATRNISKLLDVRGETAHLIVDGETKDVDPATVAVGRIIEVRPGDRVPLDGTLKSAAGTFDTSALTGESVPRDMEEGDSVLAGMISSQSTVRIAVDKVYSQSALSRILDMVGQAASRKAHAELFIRRFAKVYTPIVILLAAMLVAVPALVALFDTSFVYVFSQWLYRALVFLVISCPCALVISVPLGYFAGIGAASRLGILFKGGNYLEAVTKVNMVAFDKTGTLTTGQFKVEEVDGDDLMLSLMAAAESGSSHPLAKALTDHVRRCGLDIPAAESLHEKAGYGVVAMVGGHNVAVGNLRMLDADGISYPEVIRTDGRTIMVCAVDGRYSGYVALADTIKPDAVGAVAALHNLGVDRVVMLSGDKKEIVDDYAARLALDEAHGALLPEDKADYVAKAAAVAGRQVAFVGDGMNDAPVLALSDVGVAMGGLGSDAAVESADVVIRTDRPSRLATAIRIGRTTHTIVKENIVGAIAIKVIILALGAAGYASLWAAVFADVGVALLAVVNSMRIMWKNYE